MKESDFEFRIFVISLERSEERRNSIQKQFNDLGLSFEFIDAIDGKYLTEEDIAKYANLEEVKENPRWLNPYAIACALSHRKAYHKILAERIPYTLILEDDMLLSSKSVDLLPSIIHEMDTDEICMLYYRAFQTMYLSLGEDRKLDPNYELLSPINEESIPLTAGAYIVSLKAVERLERILLPIRYAADSWAEFYREGGVNKISCVYPRPLKDANFKSTIDYFSTDRLDWRRRFGDWVDREKVPFLYALLKWKRAYKENQMSRVKLVEQASIFRNN
ncbi:glycosyltransferase family 25 protein [Sediminitomix flava]|uniref:Glycosyl transferase family 25 n=1 Tax=Sediminitomix flava TaxID=379075 RepID=A0A315ZDT3_SEDFL|nr:glycosyltransferase family 25 protein [Sediminitomix flava]PWJ43289.1 glycosyl transferase family 25 [Sediminitomix flava]